MDFCDLDWNFEDFLLFFQFKLVFTDFSLNFSLIFINFPLFLQFSMLPESFPSSSLRFLFLQSLETPLYYTIRFHQWNSIHQFPQKPKIIKINFSIETESSNLQKANVRSSHFEIFWTHQSTGVCISTVSSAKFRMRKLRGKLEGHFLRFCVFSINIENHIY